MSPTLTAVIWGQDPDVSGPPVPDDRTAVVDLTGDAPRHWTRADLRAAVAAVAARVRDAAVVAVLMENCAEFVAAYHGVVAAGAAVLPLDPRATPAEWATAVAAHAVDLVVVDHDRPGLPPGVTAITVPAPGAGRPPGLARSDPPDGGDGRTAVLGASSGTQGTAKTVIITHGNLVANLDQIAGRHRLRPDDVVLAVTPLRHIYGMQMAMNPALRAGVPLVLAPTGLTPARLLDLVVAHGVTVAYLVPSVVAEVGAAPPAAPAPTWRLAVSGGAPLPAAAAKGFTARTGVPVVQGFGMTEAGCISFTPDGETGRPDTVGVPVPDTELRFVDPATGDDAMPGELWIRGPQVTPGYLGDPEATAALVDPDGWLHTGDLALREDDGHLRIVGRVKNLIKYKGHQVAPAELEDVLTSHPAVLDAVVVGEPHPVAGELPKAYVVLGEPVPLTDLRDHVAARVAPHQRLRVIERVIHVPRSTTGKASPARLAAGPLAGTTALVTGGGRGLGRVFTRALVAAGARVLVTGRDAGTLAAAAAELGGDDARVVPAVADVLDPDALARALDGFGPPDVVVNNAALPGPLGPLWGVDPDDWWQSVEVAVRGTQLVCHAVLPGMLERGHGRVITVVSAAGRLRWPGASAYSVGKAAQIKLVENLAAELRGTGVSALAFDPGLLDAGMTHDHLVRGAVDDPWADRILQWTEGAKASGRFASVPAAADHLVALAAGAADDRSGRYLTGADLGEWSWRQDRGTG